MGEQRVQGPVTPDPLLGNPYTHANDATLRAHRREHKRLKDYHAAQIAMIDAALADPNRPGEAGAWARIIAEGGQGPSQ